MKVGGYVHGQLAKPISQQDGREYIPKLLQHGFGWRENRKHDKNGKDPKFHKYFWNGLQNLGFEIVMVIEMVMWSYMIAYCFEL